MIWSFLTSFFQAVGSVFGFASKRQDLKNAPDVRQAEIAQKNSDAKDKIEDHVEKRDVDATRRDIAG